MVCRTDWTGTFSFLISIRGALNLACVSILLRSSTYVLEYVLEFKSTSRLSIQHFLHLQTRPLTLTLKMGDVDDWWSFEQKHVYNINYILIYTVFCFSWENTWIHITSETGLTRWILNSCIRLKWVKRDRDGKWEKAWWWWNGSPRTLYQFYLLFGFMESSMCYGLLDFILALLHSTLQYFV